MKRKILVFIILCFMVCLGLYACALIKENPQQPEPQPNEQQLQCEHEYAEIGWSIASCSDGSGTSYDIYCPKCQWETTVSYKEWNRIQADMNYKHSK